MQSKKKLLTALNSEGVEYIIIGGVAAVLYGSQKLTFDIDICYRRSNDNIGRIVRILRQFNPMLRGVKERVKFVFDERLLKNGMNFTFTTDEGDVDLLGEVSGVGRYEDMVESSEIVDLDGCECRVISLEQLISAKKAARRKKDLEIIHELEAIQEIRRKTENENS